MIKLDYSLSTPEERNKLVEDILAETPDPSGKYLEILADYLVLCMEKQEKKERSLLTENRMVTVNKRETSFEGLVSQLENDTWYGALLESHPDYAGKSGWYQYNKKTGTKQTYRDWETDRKSVV